MRKYFCDICGKEFDPAAGPAEDRNYDAAAACPSVRDVCPKCEAKGRVMDVESIILFAWRAGMKSDEGMVRPLPAGHGCAAKAEVPPAAVPAPDSKPGGEAKAGMPPAAVPAPDNKFGNGAAKAEMPPASVSVPDNKSGSGEAKAEMPPASVSVPDNKSGSGDAKAEMPPAAVPVPDNAPVTGAADAGKADTAPDTTAAPPGRDPLAKRASRQPDKAPQPVKKSGGPGSHWAEKRETMERLQAYRRNGGSTAEIAGASGVSMDVVRAMIEAKPRPIDEWRAVKSGLDKLEGKA